MTIAKKYDLLIFDWDGTLMDSHGYVMANLKNQMPEPMARMAIDASLKFIKQSDQKLNKIYEDYYFDAFAKAGPQLFPSVLPTLQILKQEGYILTVATSMSRKSLDVAMQRFQVAEFFDATRCSEETASKPDPMMLESLLEEFNVKPEQALMIGDTENDMLMAQTIQMDRVAMITGVHTIDRLEQYQPLACLDDIQKLIDLLSREKDL